MDSSCETEIVVVVPGRVVGRDHEEKMTLEFALLNQVPSWDETTLRKRALAFSKLVSKKTSASQTTVHAFRREVATQIYLPVEHDTNTGIPKVTGE